MSRRVRTYASSALLFAALVLSNGPRLALGQDIPLTWQQWSGPLGRITHLASEPGGEVMVAVSATGVNRRDDRTQWFDSGQIRSAAALYRSTDGGRTWVAFGNDLPPGLIDTVFIDPRSGDLFVGLGAGEQHSGLWRLDRKSDGWRQVVLGRDNLIVRRIASSADGRMLLAGAVERGESSASYVFRSTDGGRTWAETPIVSPEIERTGALSDLIPHPSDPTRLQVTTLGGSLIASSDGGETWSAQPVTASAEVTTTPARLSFRPELPDGAYVVQTTPGGLTLHRSSDRGVTWRRANPSGLQDARRAHALLALNAGVLLLSTDAGAYRSVDDGVSWQPLEGALGAGGVSQFLRVVGSGAEVNVLAATGYGVFISRDAGALWQPLGSGLPQNSKIWGLLTHPLQPGLVVAISDNRLGWGGATPPAVLVSADGGKRWMPASGLPDVQLTAWALDPANSDVVFVVASDKVFRSADAGVSWEATGVPMSSRTALAVAHDGKRLYLSGDPAMRSVDGGTTWREMPLRADQTGNAIQMVNGIAVHPKDATHVWAASDAGVFESHDGGVTWVAAGLDGRKVRWLAVADPASEDASTGLYAGVNDDGVYRLGAGAWTRIGNGLPASSNILAFEIDPRNPGVLWATRDGGGVYRSTDGGVTMVRAGSSVGDNLVQALAVDYSSSEGVLLGTANAGIWSLGSEAPATPASPTPVATSARTALSAGVDARIEVLWPHDFAPVDEAKRANMGLRLFAPGSLQLPACGWRPTVTLWRAVGTNPAEPLALAEQRTVDGAPFPYWDVNDIDVSTANDPKEKLYFFVQVDGVSTATSVWAHGADARTNFPVQDAPSGLASGAVDEVDARIQIVWPHDEAGREQAVDEAPLANVAVVFFKHGTRLSLPPDWQPSGLTLYGAWNQEVSKPLSRVASRQVRQAGAITYPVWEFHNIPVGRAAEGTNRLYLWAIVEGIQTHPSVWAHGADSRTYFPDQDEPILGCTP